MTATDPWQRRVSTTPEAAELWAHCLARLTAYRSGAVEALQRVIEADPDFAVARCTAAHLALLRAEPAFDPVTELAAAEHGNAVQPWEQSLVRATATWVRHGLWVARPRILAHHEDHPDDLLGLALVTTVHSWSAEPDRIERMLAAAEHSAASLGDDPAVSGVRAMALQDLGRLTEARRLAEQILDRDPHAVLGAHPLAHVFFETGDHRDGLGWLDTWLQAADRGSVLVPHLGWHAALHLLELGEPGEALRRYAEEYEEHGVQLADSPSLLWRCQLAGVVPHGTDPHEPTTRDGLAPLLDGSPPTFQSAHLALALATAADADGLRRHAARARGSLVPGTAELIPDLALGLAAYVEGVPGLAADHLLRLEPHFERYGGSHAQREVFEDTLIRALLADGRTGPARSRLLARLDRRESRLDSGLLAAT